MGDGSTRADIAVRSDVDAIADDGAGGDGGSGADARLSADNGARLDPDPFGNLRGRMDKLSGCVRRRSRRRRL